MGALLLALLAFAGCDEPDRAAGSTSPRKLSDFDPNKRAEKDEKDSKKKKAEQDPDETRNKVLEQLRDNQMKRIDAQQKALAGDPKQDKKKAQDKFPSNDVMALNGNGNPLQFEDGKKKKNKKDPNAGIYMPDALGGIEPDQGKVHGAGAVQLGDKGFKRGDPTVNDARIFGNHGTAEFNLDAAKGDEKPSFLSKIFGNHKPEDRSPHAVANGSQTKIEPGKVDKKKLGQVIQEKPDGTEMGAKDWIAPDELKKRYAANAPHELGKISAFTPTYSADKSEKTGSLAQRIQDEMMLSRLDVEAKLRAKRETAGEVVPLPGERQGAVTPTPAAARALPRQGTELPAPSTAATGGGNTLDATAASVAAASAGTAAALVPKTDSTGTVPTPQALADKQWGTLDDYHAGLKSGDMLARDKAFQRAMYEKRADAIPYLTREIIEGGALADRAPRYLAAIGQMTGDVEHALLTGLNENGTHDGAVRIACAQALGVLHCRKGLVPLSEKARNDRNYNVRSACVAALGVLGDASAVPLLRDILAGAEIEIVKESAALALARFGDAGGREHLLRCLDARDPALQVIGIIGLAQLNDPDAPGQLVSRLDSQSDEVWGTAVALLTRLGANSTLPLLRIQLQGYNDTIRMRAALALGYLGSDEGLALVVRAARGGCNQEREMAVDLMGQLGREDLIPQLIDSLRDGSPRVRQRAALALARLNAKAAIPALTEAARQNPLNDDLPPALQGASQDPL